MTLNLASFTDVLGDTDEIDNSQPLSLPSSQNSETEDQRQSTNNELNCKKPSEYPKKCTGQYGDFRSVEEIDPKYRAVFSYPYFNLVQSRVIEDALYSDKSMVVCAPTGSGKTVIFEMAIVQLLIELERENYTDDFKIIYMAPVKALCTERLTEWYPKFTKLGLLCIEVTGDTDVDFSQLKPYRIIITTPEKWDMLTRRWRDHRALVDVIKLFLIDEVHILNDATRGPVLEAVVSRMKTIESSTQSAHRIEQLQKQYVDAHSEALNLSSPPRIRFIAISATVSNPEDVAAWLGTKEKPAVYYKFGDECRPVKLNRLVEGYPCPEGMSIFKFDIILSYKLWPIIQKYHNGKPTLIFCNTRKSVIMTAETLSRELTINFTPEQKARLTALASTTRNKKLQTLLLSGVGCHHAGLLYEERLNIENAFRNGDLPILITTTTLAMGVNLPAHLVIIKNTQQYVNGAYQEYSISTVLQMVGRAGRPQFDTEATAVIMTRLGDKKRYQELVGGSEPLQSYLHKRLAENLNSEAALGTVTDVAQCVQWLRSTFLCVRAARDPRKYLGVQPDAPEHIIVKKIEELCVKAMNGLASSGLITMDEASCIESTEAGRLMSIYYLDLETMKHIMKIEGSESLDKLLNIICESHELADMHLRVDERRCLNTLNRNNAAATIRFPMKGKIMTRQMKLNCIIQAVLGCLPIPEPSLNQEAMKIMRIADRICKCLVAYITRPDLIAKQPQYFPSVLNSIILAKCIAAHLWENSPYVSRQLKGIGPAISTLLAAAGKVNFMLLEESHPRDLERIINKSAPAGNVIRKQISLLPKYQIAITPKDRNTISVQLTLLNQAYLAENLDSLTLGGSHKSYIVVGDSQNHILLLTSFKDNDLISLYAGSLTYEITRNHEYEYKIFAHCVSANFVGLDVQAEHTFTGLVSHHTSHVYELPQNIEDRTPKRPNRQTTITDSFKELKRKNNDLNITQSKEKKKRDNAVIEKFKHLKKEFGYTTQKFRKEIQESAELSDNLLQYMMPQKSCTKFNTNVPCINDTAYKGTTDNDVIMKGYDRPVLNAESIKDKENYTSDEHVQNILKEIENEISNNGMDSYGSEAETCSKVPQKETQATKNITTPYIQYNHKKYKPKQKRFNFDFLDLLERNENLSDSENNTNTDGGFSETIKNQVEKFLKTTNTTIQNNFNNTNLLSNYSNFDKSIKMTEFSQEQLSKSTSTPTINSTSAQITNPIGVTENDNIFFSQHIEGESRFIDEDTQIQKYEIEGINDITNMTDFSETKSKSIRVDAKNIHQSSKGPQYHITETLTNPTEFNATVAINEISNNADTIKPEDMDDSRRNDSYYKPIQNKNEGRIFNKINDSPIPILIPKAIATINEKAKSLIFCDDSLSENQHKNEGKISLVMEKGNDTVLQSRNENQINKQLDTVQAITQETSNANIEIRTNTFRESNDPQLVDEPNFTELCIDDKCFENKLEVLNYDEQVKVKTGIPPNRDVSNTAITNRLNVFLQELGFKSSTAYGPRSSLNFNQSIMGFSNISNIHDNINPLGKQSNMLCTPPNKSETLIMIPKTFNKEIINKESDSGTVCSPENSHMNCNVENANKNVRSSSNSKKNEYTNKYGYTTTKINISTKTFTDHELQIIRKLKVDLDVTEILRHKVTQFQTNYPENIRKDDIRSPSKSGKYSRHTPPFEVVSDKNPLLTASLDGQNIINTPLVLENTFNVPANIESKWDDRLKNVLHKYSRSLKKHPIHVSINNTTKYDIKEPPSQVKRPYKINEINKMDISLPQDFTTKTNNEAKIKNIEVLDFNESQSNSKVFKDQQLCKYSSSKAPSKTYEYDIDDYENTYLDDTLTKTSLEPSLDFNIDQSMLDPKALLQCFYKDEHQDILPPPIEFDDRESEVDGEDALDATESLVRSKYSETEFDFQDVDEASLEQEYHKRSIFITNSSPTLTPSKEIETWTFSCENVTSNSILYKSRQYCDFSLETAPPVSNRKSKLLEFKHKDKIKLRK